MQVTKADVAEAKKLIVTIPQVQGEVRSVQKCCDCGKLFGRRFIPFGIGAGASFNLCLCQITGHRSSLTVIERRYDPDDDAPESGDSDGDLELPDDSDDADGS